MSNMNHKMNSLQIPCESQIYNPFSYVVEMPTLVLPVTFKLAYSDNKKSHVFHYQDSNGLKLPSGKS